ncbi:MAG: bifunctional phosphopantothenoylcysteine decarboxylase/phosphopantothenate--cysteine ligase CoaBC [Actinomycetaceae bacterium]|nr:bifunctional phosphopantothenoylcysteine decarboxylase/phosphopantothenate--cysteine ligase CoaBC [Actinomycetaceae bacterium]
MVSPLAAAPPQRIIIGIGAGIAAYKIPYLARRLIKDGHDVRIIPTPASLEFVGKTTWSALSDYPVYSDVFEADAGVDHVEAARQADLIIVAPATADLIARMRAGRADDLLTTTLLAATCPVVVVPAMHTAMWEHPATKDNISMLRSRGIVVIEPVEGDLSSGDTGRGRLPEPDDIATAINDLLRTEVTQLPLNGTRAFVTAGGTHEAIDPVRFIGNRSSGRQGCEIAAALRDLGADVTLFAAHIDPELLPSRVRIVETPTAQIMCETVLHEAQAFHIGVFVAAVADFRPREVADQKIKKSTENEGGLTLELVRNPDVLASTVETYPELFTVGFAAETGNTEDVLRAGRDKARRKGATLLAINRVGAQEGFGNVDNELTVVDHSGQVLTTFAGSKHDLARSLCEMIADYYRRSRE